MDIHGPVAELDNFAVHDVSDQKSESASASKAAPNVWFTRFLPAASQFQRRCIAASFLGSLFQPQTALGTFLDSA